MPWLCRPGERDTRDGRQLSFAAGAVTTGLRRDNTAVPLSYGSRDNPRAVTGYRSEDSRTAAWFRQSRGSGSAAPHPRGVDRDNGASGDRAPGAGTPIVD